MEPVVQVVSWLVVLLKVVSWPAWAPTTATAPSASTAAPISAACFADLRFTMAAPRANIESTFMKSPLSGRIGLGDCKRTES